MCQKVPERNPLLCVMPPFVLEAIIKNGTPAQRAAALATLSVTSTLRSMRSTQALAQANTVRRAPMTALVPGQAPPINRSIYDGKLSNDLPGTLVLSEGQEYHGTDEAVKEAFKYLGSTFQFYFEAYGRNSIDDAGLPLIATVNYREDPSEPYSNAAWTGEQMIFGDGDGSFFLKRMTRSADVMGHELTHGVVQYGRNLIYLGQSGALNESVADVFGSLVKQFLAGQTAEQADKDPTGWLIGDELIDDTKVKSKSGHTALRSLKAPGTAFDDPVWGKDPQPDRMSKYVNTLKDRGGVHTNSGIPNKAFYLAATAIKGKAWEKAGLVWYQTIHDLALPGNATFVQFARVTLSNAAQQFGRDSDVYRHIADAWKAVEVL